MSMTALIILSAIVLLSCTILKRVSARIGVPTLLLFILLGMVFGSDGLVNIPFDDYAFAEKLSMVALAIITSPNSAAPQQRHSSSQSACRKISKMLSLIRFSMKGSSCKNRWKETQCPLSIP